MPAVLVPRKSREAIGKKRGSQLSAASSCCVNSKLNIFDFMLNNFNKIGHK
jgi:hypothetical protein